MRSYSPSDALGRRRALHAFAAASATCATGGGPLLRAASASVAPPHVPGLPLSDGSLLPFATFRRANMMTRLRMSARRAPSRLGSAPFSRLPRQAINAVLREPSATRESPGRNSTSPGPSSLTRRRPTAMPRRSRSARATRASKTLQLEASAPSICSCSSGPQSAVRIPSGASGAPSRRGERRAQRAALACATSTWISSIPS